MDTPFDVIILGFSHRRNRCLIRWLVQNTGSRNRSSGGTGSQAMDILKERFAKGEITRDEFESMKKEILR